MSSNVLDVKKYQYPRMKVRDKDGSVRYSANNGDAISRAMVGMVKDDMIKVMKDNHLEEKLSRHLKGKNPGHFRMMLGQALRGMVGRKTPVKIKGQTISRLNQKVELMRGLEEEKITPRAVKNRKKKN